MCHPAITCDEACFACSILDDGLVCEWLRVATLASVQVNGNATLNAGVKICIWSYNVDSMKD